MFMSPSLDDSRLVYINSPETGGFGDNLPMSLVRNPLGFRPRQVHHQLPTITVSSRRRPSVARLDRSWMTAHPYTILRRRSAKSTGRLADDSGTIIRGMYFGSATVPAVSGEPLGAASTGLSLLPNGLERN